VTFRRFRFAVDTNFEVGQIQAAFGDLTQYLQRIFPLRGTAGHLFQ
jgi:hypothetical protein